jgi:hypothetical protein
LNSTLYQGLIEIEVRNEKTYFIYDIFLGGQYGPKRLLSAAGKTTN